VRNDKVLCTDDILISGFFFHRAEAEANAWSETIQALNNRQATIIEALARRAEKRKMMESEFQTSWNASAKEKPLGQRQSTGTLHDSTSPARLQAQLLSKVWDWSLDDVSKDPALARSADLVTEEMRAGIGVLDEAETKLEARMQDIESLVS